MNTKFESYIGYEDLRHTIHVTPLTAALFRRLGLSLNAAVVFDYFLRKIEEEHKPVIPADLSDVKDHLITFTASDLHKKLYGVISDQALRRRVIPSLIDAGLFKIQSYEGGRGICYKVYYSEYYKLVYKNFKRN